MHPPRDTGRERFRSASDSWRDATAIREYSHALNGPPEGGPSEEVPMKRALLLVLAAVTGAQAQAPIPTFEVDRTWPSIPATMRVGDASSFAVDKSDRVWLLHRPRTLKPEDA